jgi:Xaa-Pro aminopeptidase
MFEARFQTFDDANERDASAAGCRAARRTEAARTSTASSCRAPTAIRTNTSRRRGAARLAHRLHRLGRRRGRARRSRGDLRRRRYQLQVREQIDTTLFSVEHLVDNPPDKWLEGEPASRGPLWI